MSSDSKDTASTQAPTAAITTTTTTITNTRPSSSSSSSSRPHEVKVSGRRTVKRPEAEDGVIEGRVSGKKKPITLERRSDRSRSRSPVGAQKKVEGGSSGKEGNEARRRSLRNVKRVDYRGMDESKSEDEEDETSGSDSESEGENEYVERKRERKEEKKADKMEERKKDMNIRVWDWLDDYLNGSDRNGNIKAYPPHDIKDDEPLVGKNPFCGRKADTHTGSEEYLFDEKVMAQHMGGFACGWFSSCDTPYYCVKPVWKMLKPIVKSKQGANHPYWLDLVRSWRCGELCGMIQCSKCTSPPHVPV